MQKPNNAAPKPAAGRRSLWNYPLFSMLLALLCGFIAWLVVTVYFDPQGTYVVSDVPINYANSASTYTALGLDIVERPEIETVDVSVSGNSTIIGNLEASDILVYPSYAGVTGAGRVTLRLQARVANTTDFPGDIDCSVVNPQSIDVVFDEVSEKTLPITVDASNVTVADGYMLNRTTAVPSEIPLRGPNSELDHIDSIVATVAEMTDLADTTTVPATLELRDDTGAPFTPQYTTMESETANITLTVYQVRELPLTVDFIGVPSNFDTDSLRYTLSQKTLRVAGPARVIGALNELTVSDFDLAREFEPGRDYQRLVELPAGVVSVDDVTSVTLSFDTSDLASTTLNLSQIRAINVPSGYEVEILSSVVNDVTVYGPADEIESLSADSVIAQIDCQIARAST